MLFWVCAEEELRDLAAASDVARFAASAMVVRQGTRVTSSASSRQGRSTSWRRPCAPTALPPPARGVLVGAPCAAGTSFGEPALMHGSPRAATVRARGDYVLRRP